MDPISTPWKHQKTLRFVDVFRGIDKMHWERIATLLNGSWIFYSKQRLITIMFITPAEIIS